MEEISRIFYAEKEKEEDIRKIMDPLVEEWFFSKFKEFSPAQLYSVKKIHDRENILISAPTGGTKTLTSFLSIINYLIKLSKKNELENKVYAIYCSPLKALGNDIFFNLVKPIEEINEVAKTKGINMQEIRIGIRTGDTSASEKNKHIKKTPHILLTTPENLAIILNSKKFSKSIEEIEFVVIDEIHSLAENKRGVHLSLTLERLEKDNRKKITRIGLSATVSPLEEMAKFLVGTERSCFIADVQFEKKTNLEVLVPYDLKQNGEFEEKNYELIDDLIRKHKTTLIFTNTRASTERVIKNLKEKFPENYIENIGAHHSSMSKEERKKIEEKLRNGELKVVVSSTSLELGIDIGYIDLVILLSSPKSVSRALQRIGRAGHKMHETAKGIFLAYDFDDLVECSVIIKNSKEKKIDVINIPKNCLDVLAQHILGMVLKKEQEIKEVFNTIKKSYCYQNLKKEDFFSVLSYLNGDYNFEIRNFYPKIRIENEIIKKRGKLTGVIYITNIGTIPDESYIDVLTKDKKEIGKIDEGFLEKLKKGDVFSIGGRAYEFKYTRGMKMYVEPSSKSPNIPSWYSESLPLSFTTAQSIQKFRYLIKEKIERKVKEEEIINFIKDYCHINERSAKFIFQYFKKQKEISHIPNEKEILIERIKIEKNIFIFHCVFGRRINEAFSRAIGYVIAKEKKRDLETGANDNGFLLSGSSLNFEIVEKAIKKINEENIYEIIEKSLEKSEILKRRFRHCAVRGLMVLRNYKGRKKSVGLQQLSSHFLLSAAKKIGENFPIYKEAKREIIEDYMDVKNMKEILHKIKTEQIKIIKKDLNKISPFSINLLYQSYKDFIKIEHKQDFIKRIYKEAIKDENP